MKEQTVSGKGKKNPKQPNPKQSTIKTWFHNLKHSILGKKEKLCNPQELKDLIYSEVAFVFQIKWAFSVIKPKKQPN